MNVSTIDIRLLLVFEALLRERSVSRAAHDIGMSQPTVSRALNILRQMLKDELFVRSPGGMLPTAQARDLAPSIREVLARLQAIFEPANFVSASLTRTFRLAVSDHCSALFCPCSPSASGMKRHRSSFASGRDGMRRWQENSTWVRSTLPWE